MQDLSDRLPDHARLLVVQYGDYLETVRQFAEGGAETYAAQRHTVEFIGSLVPHLERVSVLVFSRDYQPVQAPNGVYCQGVDLYRSGQRNQHLALVRAAARERPTHVIAVAPILPLLYWAWATRRELLPLFADSFRAGGPKERIKARLLAWLLNRPAIPWVANHNLAASVELSRIGVRASKILPFEVPMQLRPDQWPAKRGPKDGPLRLIYVGSMVASKGVGDAIRAVTLLRGEGADVELSLVGGESEEFRSLVEDLGVDSAVHFLGRQSHDRVVPLMNEHDACLIPSRHEYPEGLPLTIYEGLCSRSPLVVSDHPMFALRMRDHENCLVFQAGSPKSMAQAIRRLVEAPGLYSRLSASAATAAEEFLCPLKWDELIAGWLSMDDEFLRGYALTQGRYGDLGLGGGPDRGSHP